MPEFKTNLTSHVGSAVDLYSQHGVLWIEDLLDRDRVENLSAYYHRKYATLSKPQLAASHAMVGDRRYMITAAIKGPMNDPELYANPKLMPILNQLLDPGFVISSFGSVLAFPGAAAQSVHFDFPPLYQDEAVCAALPPHAITLVIPLVDITSDTGSTAVWPGSHNRTGSRDELERLVESGAMDGSVCPTPKMGDAFLMDFRLIHAGTPNVSDSPRPILYIVYSRPWFREDMNFQEQPRINMSDKQLKKVPKKLRHLFATTPAG